jgi:predicted nuclease with TOPRIM domain
LEGKTIKITNTNFPELKRLCEEFSFSKIATKLSEFWLSMDFKKGKAEDADARERIEALEEKPNQHSHVIVMLQNEVTQLSTDFGRRVGEVSALKTRCDDIRKQENTKRLVEEKS